MWSSSAPARPGSRRRPTSTSRAGTPPPCSRPTTSSAASAAPSSATAGASTSAATASSPRCPRSRQFWHEILPDDDFLLRPRMSRIFYNGKFFDYPLKADQRPEEPGHHRGDPVRARRTLWARVRPPKDQTNFEGWTRRPLRLAPLPDVLQDLHREGLGRAGHRDARPTGRPSASRTCRWRAPSSTRSLPDAEPEGRSPRSSRSSSTPSLGPGMMWERLPANRSRPAAPRSLMRDPGRRDPPRATGGPPAWSRRPAMAETVYPADHVISSMPISPPAEGHGPAGARRGRPRAADDLALPRLPHRRARRARGRRASPTTGSTSTPRGERRAHPELRLVVALPGQGRPDLPRPRVLRVRGRRAVGRWPTRS